MSTINDFFNLKPETMTQKAYTIGGVPIMFPCKAYPSQISMMDKIIKCLNKKHNCLLESPTGSGKSLALLCSTLAWLKKTEKQINEMEQVFDNHLNAYGVTIADDIQNSVREDTTLVTDFQKFRFGNKCNETNDVKLIEAGSEKVESKFFCADKCSNSGCIIDENCKRSPHVSDTLQMKFKPSQHSLKKRGINYLNDDDMEDFQPLKKNRFSSEEFHQFSTSPNKNFISDSGASKQNASASDFLPEPLVLEDIKPESTPCSKKISENQSLPSKLPKVYFGTRTHKQIGQIIRELKKTPYRDVKMTILSSRERTCIHPKNSRAKNKNEGCDELIKRENGPLCDYYKNIRRVCYYHPPEMSTAFDLEDFISICRRKSICPYFGARELLQSSEIVFCPYNYLVDPLIRSALSISLKDSIIIMDEAHNIEDSAREAANRTISVSQLQDVIADALQIGQLKKDDSEPYMHLAKVLENLKKWLENSNDLKDYVSFDSSAKVWSGDDMIAVLDYVGLGPDTFPIFQSNYAKIYREENETDKTKTEVFDEKKLSGSTHMCLKGLIETLNYLYKDNLNYVPDFRCVVKKSKSSSDESSLISASQAFKRKSFPSAFEITVNFWCLNPAVVFSDMKDIHSLIVASGTLAPLASFQSELGIPFQTTLEANHVVSREHMWVGTIGRGPSNNCLTGTFQHASTFAFQDDIGNLVLEVCSVIPHGILCFLPSYSMLDKLVNRWRITGLWDKLLCKKVVLCEPRRSNEDFQQIIQEFYDAVKDSETDTDSEVSGALFLAVCRGKSKEYTFKGHGDSVDQLCWHPSNPDLLATASLDKTVRIWDAKLQKSIATVQTKGENINICWSPNGQTIAVGNKEDLVTFIDVRTHKIVNDQQFKFEVNELSWNNDNSYFFLTNGQGCIYILSYPDLQIKHILSAHPANCICIEFDKTGKYFATGSVDALVSLWDVETLVCVRTFSRLEWPVRTISFSHDGCMLASASEDHLVDITDVHTGEKIAEVPCESPTFTVAWHPKRHLLAFACDDKDKHTRDRDAGTVKLFGLSSDS